MMKKILLCFFSTVLLLSAGSTLAQNSVRGTVTDSETGEALVGANVVIEGTTIGASAGLDGSFNLSSDKAMPWSLVISYTGYKETKTSVSNSGARIAVSLETDAIIGEEVIISASRIREKVQEAPASVSVLGAKTLENTPQVDNPVRNLINVPGVQIQQQSASRMNIEMRGQAGLFGTSVFPIMDYRSLVGPGIGTFDSNAAGLSNIDLQRIEVVRGAGSALYGPGVTSGVIHFITKNPIDYPGTCIELIGGGLNTIGGTVRHAQRNEKQTFGFKVNAHYKQGDEFTLDGSEGTTTNGVFTSQIDKFKKSVRSPGITPDGYVDVSSPGTVLWTEADLDPDGDGNMMQNDWYNGAINATLEFRPQDDLTVFLSGGYNEASSVFYNSQGEGLSNLSEYWTQARVQKGGFFAQVFYVNNTGGSDDKPTFLYQTGLSSRIARTQLEAQGQYNFQLPNLLNSNWTVGVDYRGATSDSFNQVYGRNEDDDDYNILGAYIQGKFALGSKFDLVLAGRYDDFNFLDDTAFSPRAALVYKAHPNHTFRATYNQASTPPSALNVNIDFPVNVPAAGIFDLWLYGQKTEHTFTNPVIDVSVPGVPDLPVGTPGLPLAIPFGLVNAPTIAGIEAALPGLGVPTSIIQALSGFLSGYTPTGTTGSLVQYDIFSGQPMPQITGTEAAKVGTVNSFELGYSGVFGDRFGINADFYTIERVGFTQFSQIGPTVGLFGADLANDLAAEMTTASAEYLTSLGVLPAASVTAISQGVGAAYAQGGAGADAALSPLYSIFGAIESDQVPQGDGITHSTLGYRSFNDASVDYWGFDLGLRYDLTDALTLTGNYSYVSQTNWFPGESDDDGLLFPYSLGIPQNKFRLGISYAKETGFRANAAFQYDESFYVGNFGNYTGDAPEKNLVDASIGYKFENGLSIDLAATNLFDNEYRAFLNMPQIGRRVLGKLVYCFGAGGNAAPKSAAPAVIMDSDGDGVIDEADQCPNQAGPAANQGCPYPDTDGDGVLDKDDECVNEAGIASNNGCPNPDTDGDGTLDVNDDCVNVAGPAANGGCPYTDTDNDGVIDNEDKCPNEAGTVANSGCPEMSVEVTETLALAVQGIEFNTGSAVIRSASYTNLDNAIAILNQYPAYSATISGHTDATGNENSNIALSQKRAEAVLSYLSDNGVDASRLGAIGYGSAQPIGDNGTAAGRQMNRRVQFDLYLK